MLKSLFSSPLARARWCKCSRHISLGNPFCWLYVFICLLICRLLIALFDGTSCSQHLFFLAYLFLDIIFCGQPFMMSLLSPDEVCLSLFSLILSLLIFLYPVFCSTISVSWYVCFLMFFVTESLKPFFFWYVCVPDICVSWYFFENRFDLLISDVASHVHITFFRARNRFKKEAAIFSADLSRVAVGWTWYKRCKPLQLKVQAKGGKGCFNQFKVVTAICQEAFSIHKLTHPYQQVHQIWNLIRLSQNQRTKVSRRRRTCWMRWSVQATLWGRRSNQMFKFAKKQLWSIIYQWSKLWSIKAIKAIKAMPTAAELSAKAGGKGRSGLREGLLWSCRSQNWKISKIDRFRQC